MGVLLLLLSIGCGGSPPPTAPPPAPVVKEPPSPPLEFKGDLLGVTTLATFQNRHGDVGGVVHGVSTVTVPGYTAAGITPLHSEFSFLDGILFRINLVVREEDGPTLLAGLESKYGKPLDKGEWILPTAKITFRSNPEVAKVTRDGAPPVVPKSLLTVEDLALGRRAPEEERKAIGEKAAKDL